MIRVGVTLIGEKGNFDVVLELPAEYAGREIVRIAQERGIFNSASQSLRMLRTGNIIGTADTLSKLDLRWGDVLAVTEGATDSPLPSFKLTSTSDQQEIALFRGTFVIGRDSDNVDLALEDASVSRQHAEVNVTRECLKIRDLGSSNGTVINGVEIQNPTVVGDGDLIEFGDAIFKVIELEPQVAKQTAQSSDGVIPFNRQPRLQVDPPLSRISLESPPNSVRDRKLPWITFMTPLIGSGVMYAMSHNPMTLLMAVLGPVGYVATGLLQKKGDLGKFKEEAAKFRDLVADRELNGLSVQAQWQQWQANRWPSLSELESLALETNEHMWWRRPNHDDFLDLRLGVSTRPSPLEFAMPATGDPALITEAQEKLSPIVSEVEQPFAFSLSNSPFVGLVGNPSLVEGLVLSFAQQLAIAHSHRDLNISIVAPERGKFFESFKWLPHISATPLAEGLSCVDPDSEAEVIRRLLMLKAERRGSDGFGRVKSNSRAHLVVIICPPIQTSRVSITELGQDLALSDMSIIWMAESRKELPGECTTVITLANAESRADGLEISGNFIPELQTPSKFEQIARSISPLRDVTASSGAESIPQSVDLLDIQEVPVETSDQILEQWRKRSLGLKFTIGVGADGPIELDLQKDGPHALVAGMTGAGKSEMLQTLVSSLALNYSTKEVSFVLVDYKGGSAFRSLKSLPHTVGFVTDLDGNLAERAIRSLNAELKRRELLITYTHDCKDLIELQSRYPEVVCPSLVIIIDEFAFLVKELPEFVERLVDVAQRGRSLGVHLILATQRPSGVISAQIQGNTNLRIALRVASPSDSNDVINVPLAGQIPSRRIGRGYVKVGAAQPQEFQAAYVGGTHGEDEIAAQGIAGTFQLSGVSARTAQLAIASGEQLPTDADFIVALVEEAHKKTADPDPARPWLDPLPKMIEASQLAQQECAILDLADEQKQVHWRYSPRTDHNLLVIGGPRSGKTMALRVIAESLSAEDAEQPWMYAFDFGNNGLSSLLNLPNFGGTASSQQIEVACRLISLLSEIASDRSLDQMSNDQLVVVFIDNWGALLASLQSIEYMTYFDTLTRLISDGRGVGIYFVISVDRANALGAALQSSIENELVFRIANPQDLSSSTRSIAKLVSGLPEGRAVDKHGNQIQFRLAHTFKPLPLDATKSQFRLLDRQSQPPLQVLPTEFPLTHLTVPDSLQSIPIGVTERGQVASIDLQTISTFLVAGPPRSGKTTALETIVSSIDLTHQVARRYFASPKKSRLEMQNGWTASTSSGDGIAEVMSMLKTDLSSSEDQLLLILDDGDDWSELGNPINTQLEQLLKSPIGSRLNLVVSVGTSRASRAFSSWLGNARNQQSGFLLWGNQESGDIFSLRLPRALNQVEPPGRGYLITPKGPVKAQFAIH